MNELITNMNDARTEITRPPHTTFPLAAITLCLLENETKSARPSSSGGAPPSRAAGPPCSIVTSSEGRRDRHVELSFLGVIERKVFTLRSAAPSGLWPPL